MDMLDELDNLPADYYTEDDWVLPYNHFDPPEINDLPPSNVEFSDPPF